MYWRTSVSALLLIILSLLLWQCQESTASAKTPTVFARFSVRYLAEDQQLRGQAELFAGDSSTVAQPLAVNGGVAFLGSGTQEKRLPGAIRYESTLRVPYFSPTNFSFQLPQRDALTQVQLDMAGLDSFEIMQASKTQGLRLRVKGGLEAGESLLLLFTDPNQEARTIVRPGPLNQEGLFIPPDALLHFSPGAYRVYLVKSKETEATIDNFHYQAVVEFYTQEQHFTLVE